MVLDELFGGSDTEEKSEKQILFEVANEVLPPVDSDKKGMSYRWDVVKKFHNTDRPPKRKDGEPYRTEDESRLDIALTQVAEVNDRSENTIRSLCIHDVYNGEDQTGQFLEDLLEIERRFDEAT